MQKRIIKILVALAIVVLLGGTAWGYWTWKHRPDPHMQKLTEMAATTSFEKIRDMSEEERKQRRDEFGKEIRQLTPEQRSQFFQQRMAERAKKEAADIAAYCALPDDQKQDYLMKKIKEEEERHKQFEAARQANGSGSGPGGPGGPGGPPDGQAGPPPGGNGNGPPSNFNRRDPYQRQQMRIQMLNNTTAEQRAQRAVYYGDLNKQRAQLGLPPARTPRWF
jgi:hypothetical protein